MTIAQLFVQLGVKGGEDLKKALGSTKSGLADVKSMSLEAKAGILAMMYGMQQLMAASSRAGASLTSFENTTGLSADALQRYQYAARQMNVENDEMEQGVRNLQKVMLDFALRKTPPKDFGLLAPYLEFDPKKMTDPFYMIQRIQEAVKRVPKELRGTMKSAIEGLGLTEGIYGAMVQGVFTKKNFDKANVYNKGETESLRQNHAAWLNIGDAIAKGIGHLNAKYGLKFVKDIEKLVPKVMDLVKALIELSNTAGAMDGLGKVFEGWGYIFKFMKDTIDAMKSTFGDEKKSAGFWDKVVHGSPAKELTPQELAAAQTKMNNSWLGKLMGKADKSPEEKEREGGLRRLAREGVKLPSAKDVTPSIPMSRIGGGKSTSIEIKEQNFNFKHDGKDAHKTGNSVKKAVKESYRQMSAQSQGS